MKLSTPFSYLTVQAISMDGGAHNVSVYTDISAEWVSASDNTQLVIWESNITGPVFTHQVMLKSQKDYTEYNDFIMRTFLKLASLLVRADTFVLHRGSCLLFHHERTRVDVSCDDRCLIIFIRTEPQQPIRLDRMSSCALSS